MEKSIIATTLRGLFLKSEPWKKAHVIWFKEAAEQLKDDSVNEWIDKPDYFQGVDMVMERLYPKLSAIERTIKARESFFDSVCKYVKQNSDVRNEGIIEYFSSIKFKYRIALITTNTKEALAKILSAANLSGLFDITECSEPNERDDKLVVFDRFVRKYSKPVIYIGGNRKDSFDYCSGNQIKCIYVNLENGPELKGVDTIYNLDDLKKEIDLL